MAPDQLSLRFSMNVNAIQYDLFLSYNWRDHQPVEAIAHALRERGLNVFLDRWYLIPVNVAAGVGRGVAKLPVGCRFLSANGIGLWQQLEQYLALDR